MVEQKTKILLQVSLYILAVISFIFIFIMSCFFTVSYGADVNTYHKFLKKYNSPLVSYSGYIIKTAKHYKVDPALVVALSGVESTFGKAYKNLHNYNNYNLWGLDNGISIYKGFARKSKYDNPKDYSIDYVCYLLGTSHYYAKYRRTHNLYDLAHVYKAIGPFDFYVANIEWIMSKLK